MLDFPCASVAQLDRATGFEPVGWVFESPRARHSFSASYSGGGKLIEDADKAEQFFDQDKLDQLQARQVEAVRYLDGVLTQLFDTVPRNTYITVTADHGELFGEGGYFGHGPIQHEKVYEVPFVEGKIR